MEKASDMEKMTQVKTIPFFHPLSRRLHVILILMIGCFCMAYTRSNLGMVMTCMVNSTSTLAHQQKHSSLGTFELEQEALRCAAANRNSINSIKEQIPVNNYGGEIDWPSNTQNIIFTGTFFGSLISALPAGYLADRTSPVNLLLFASVVLSLTSALFPYFALNFNYQAVFFLRFLTGLGEGLMLPAVNAIISRWVPNQEKAQAVSLFTVGAQMSGAVGVPISAGFCASTFRWPGVFYFSSIFILGWAVVLRFTTSNSPAKAKCMTNTERTYLEHSLENHRPINKEPHRVPWKEMLTSKPVMACLFVSFTFNTLMALIHSYQPSFFKEVLYLKMVDNGIFSALPHIAQMSTKMFWSIGIDFLKQRKIISNTAGCKISQVVACMIGGSMLLLIAAFADCAHPKFALFMFIILGAGLGPATSGFYTSMVTLAPAFTGTLSSISMLIGFLGMLFTPFLVSIFRVYGTSNEWSNVFISIAILVLSSGVVFGMFASGEPQPWGRRKSPIQSFINIKEDPLLKFDPKADAALIESAME